MIKQFLIGITAVCAMNASAFCQEASSSKSGGALAAFELSGPVRSVTYKSDYEWTYEFDRKGVLVQTNWWKLSKIKKNPGGGFTCNFTSRAEDSDSDPLLQWLVLSDTYNQKGLLISKEGYESCTLYTYTSDGKLKRKEERDQTDRYCEIYRYDKDGRLSGISGVSYWEGCSEKDKEYSPEVKVTFLSYDSFGNWTKRMVGNTLEERLIEYFEEPALKEFDSNGELEPDSIVEWDRYAALCKDFLNNYPELFIRNPEDVEKLRIKYEKLSSEERHVFFQRMSMLCYCIAYSTVIDTESFGWRTKAGAMEALYHVNPTAELNGVIGKALTRVKLFELHDNDETSWSEFEKVFTSDYYVQLSGQRPDANTPKNNWDSSNARFISTEKDVWEEIRTEVEENKAKGFRDFPLQDKAVESYCRAVAKGMPCKDESKAWQYGVKYINDYTLARYVNSLAELSRRVSGLDRIGPKSNAVLATCLATCEEKLQMAEFIIMEREGRNGIEDYRRIGSDSKQFYYIYARGILIELESRRRNAELEITSLSQIPMESQLQYKSYLDCLSGGKLSSLGNEFVLAVKENCLKKLYAEARKAYDIYPDGNLNLIGCFREELSFASAIISANNNELSEKEYVGLEETFPDTRFPATLSALKVRVGEIKNDKAAIEAANALPPGTSRADKKVVLAMPMTKAALAVVKDILKTK